MDIENIEKLVRDSDWVPWGKNETTLFFNSRGYKGCVEYVSDQSVATKKECQCTMERVEDRIADPKFNVVMLSVSDHFYETYVNGEYIGSASVPISPSYLERYAKQ